MRTSRKIYIEHYVQWAVLSFSVSLQFSHTRRESPSSRIRYTIYYFNDNNKSILFQYFSHSNYMSEWNHFYHMNVKIVRTLQFDSI